MGFFLESPTQPFMQTLHIRASHRKKRKKKGEKRIQNQHITHL
jgi:hypothetical protein